VLAALVLSPALRLASYRAWADGAFGEYWPGVAAAAGLAALVWMVVRWQTWPGAALPWILAAAVLVPGDVVHYLRLARGPATTFDRLVLEGFTAAEPDGAPSAQRWLVDASPDATIGVADGQLQIVGDDIGRITKPVRQGRFDRAKEIMLFLYAHMRLSKLPIASIFITVAKSSAASSLTAIRISSREKRVCSALRIRS
jgi:hypothetical protein